MCTKSWFLSYRLKILCNLRAFVKCQTGQKSVKDGIIIKKSRFIFSEKGMGYSHGGSWRLSPNKPQDQRFIGIPGEIKEYIKPNGERFETKIGEDGRAIMERHYTDHNQPWAHSSPHDHEVDWNNGYPHLGPHINYSDGNVPEFKLYQGVKILKTLVQANTTEQNRFVTISDFKWCMQQGGEVDFEWKNKRYSITHRAFGISISEANKQETEKICKDADEVLEYMVGEDRLRDVITKVTVWDRTI